LNEYWQGSEDYPSDNDSDSDTESNHSFLNGDSIGDDELWRDIWAVESDEPCGGMVDEPGFHMKRELAHWASTGRIPRHQVTKLLHILQPSMSFLPLDSRTLLKTLRVVETNNMHPGKYHHRGLAYGLKVTLDTHPDAWAIIPDKLLVFINTDGLPLTKSTSHQFWPILCVFFDAVRTKYTFEVGIYYGKEKPANFNEFLVRCLFLNILINPHI